MEISKIKVGKRFRKDIGELETLKNSIKELGLLQPIVIDEKNNLIAGLRRLLACRELGMKKITTNVIKIENALNGECDENVIRKSFTPSEEVAIWGAMEKPKGGAGKTRSESEQVIKRASKLLGKSTDTLSKAKQVVESGEKELIEKMDKTGNVNGVYQMIKSKKLLEKIPKIPEGEFDILYIDPPWKYDFSPTTGRSIENHYPTMDLEELKATKLPSAKNCLMLLWATAPKLKWAIELMEHWGFEYKTCSVWNKEKMGMGYWFRINHELLLVGVKGKFSPPEISTRVRSIYSEKAGKHSKKPDFYYDLIEKQFPGRKYLELFARQKYNDKWSVWGNESLKN